MTDERSIELEIEVPGTPEEVWRAIATGPGISSWFVPHTVEEVEGGKVTMSFGPDPAMTGTAHVAAWEPPDRVVFADPNGEGLAFEWLVEARDGASCIVRLVNTGFGSGADWDAQYDGMSEGWPMFLENLRLHLQHFTPQTATPSIPAAMWPTSRQDAWRRLTEQLGIPATPAVGDLITSSGDCPRLAGEVTDVTPNRVSLLLTEPVPGTALIAAEGAGDTTSVSVWLYLYGPDSESVADAAQTEWGDWLAHGSAIDDR